MPSEEASPPLLLSQSRPGVLAPVLATVGNWLTGMVTAFIPSRLGMNDQFCESSPPRVDSITLRLLGRSTIPLSETGMLVISLLDPW